jgi:photosystem II stability/assembly factor-like uncharacterized protein
VDTEQLSPRRRRATALIALAVIAMAVASLAYLYSNKSPNPQGAAESNDPLLVTRDYVTYSFTSPTEGWALDILPNTAPTAGQFVIFRTVDGGKHWQRTFTSDGEFFNYGAMPVQTVDAAHSFILVRGATDRLYRTADGGAHWDVVAIPSPRVAAFVFSDPNYGWLLDGWIGRDLYATRDRGATWQRLPAPPPGASRIILRGSSDAWMSDFGLGTPLVVYTSADEGQHWQRHDLPPPPGGSWGSGPFLELQLLPRTGVVVANVLGGGPASFFATSFDGGVTWRYVQPPPGTVAYQDAYHWWAIRGKVLSKSSDAGETWTQVTDALPDWLFRPDLHVLDAKRAWVTMSVPASSSAPGGNGLAFTDDGGLHWTRVRVPHGG